MSGGPKDKNRPRPQTMRQTRLPTLAAALVAAVLGISAAGAATPPPQPKTGPGGSEYSSTSVVKRAVGRAGAATFVFHGNGPAPAEGRPVVVFLHGWGAVNPQVYGSWIEHLARRGNLVLFPRYQEINRTRPADATGIAGGLVKDALAALAADPDAKPDAGRLALIGHLAGSAIAMNLAAEADKLGLPKPKLILATMPGGIAKDAASRGILLDDLSKVDAATMLITLIGDRDSRAADAASRRLLRETTAIPLERKLFMRALSDDHGFPSLSATLAAPAGVNPAFDGGAIKLPPDPPRDPKNPGPRFKWSADMALTGEQQTLMTQLNNARTDSLDYLAFWKTFDMAASAAFAGRDGVSLRNDPRFTEMDRWNDTWPVKRLFAETPRAHHEAAPAQNTRAPTQLPVSRRR
jgi:dienelactone hydrolase